MYTDNNLKQVAQKIARVAMNKLVLQQQQQQKITAIKLKYVIVILTLYFDALRSIFCS